MLFFARDTVNVARDLIGCSLRHATTEGTAAGIIVETEAYLGPSDGASHARFGLTRRNSVMYGCPGTAYVFFIYGMHHMFNAVTEPEGTAGAVLIRALEPTRGTGLMSERRGTDKAGALASGPARLAQALAITMEQNGADLTRGPLGIWGRGRRGAQEIATGRRIGVAGSVNEQFRFYEKGNRHVSG